ncbi:cyclic nucleotide-binding domain-containing protein [Nocardioides sp. ChNu-153]|uniref:Crp/Fnr family transcriptional regulator n=1 Tax=unclassified Nocardioides TaxID=2615069 RepID=UPI002404DD66|nr:MULTISPECIES: cyclic nucleotide-binding domain-containing protein [unclassified Nocardioides]MDF9714892.1 cyclic nucleotide-binding domain-containing protein [Nocardioides sp. ChNu-99]MDN7123107.1 cyclic nucleotide-binding domain-containing protein [Nocardioides sp. ChNu-153]
MSVFDALSPAEIEKVKAAGTTLPLPAGWSPISERTGADKAYVILEGEVSVRKGGTEIATLGPGDIMGEMAIINHTLRSATIVALTRLKVVHLSPEAIEKLDASVPAFGEAVRAAAAARVGDDG